jgi:transposase
MTHQHEDTPCPNCGLSKAAFQELSKRVEEQAQEIVELKKRLLRYENSNSPPSKNSAMFRAMKNKRMEERREREQSNNNNNSSSNGSPAAAPMAALPKKPGRKNGHVGITQVFEPTGEPIIHTIEKCPICNSTRLTVTSKEKRTLVDIPEPLPYTARQHIINVYGCLNCGANELIPESARRDLPSSSVVVTTQDNSIVTIGRNTLSTISLLWSVGRLTQRNISYVIESLYHLKLSATTVGHALEKVSESLAAFHEKVRKGINRSKKANLDETTMPVAGKKFWIWIAATGKYAYVQIVKSMVEDVLKEYFPKFKGVAIVDGLKIYKHFFKVIQRCWAHILNEALALYLNSKGKGMEEEAQMLLSSLRKLFHETKSELKRDPPPNRKLHDKQLRKLRYLLSKKYRDPDVKAFVSKLKRASGDLFTFTLYPGVQPTNNHAERELREPIVHRRIRGQLKSEKGIKMFSRLMTAVSTWQLQGLNPFTEFKKIL